MREITHFIDGASVAGTSGRYGDVFNPNAGEVQARVALASKGEVDAAVAAQAWRTVASPAEAYELVLSRIAPAKKEAGRKD